MAELYQCQYGAKRVLEMDSDCSIEVSRGCDL